MRNILYQVNHFISPDKMYDYIFRANLGFPSPKNFHIHFWFAVHSKIKSKVYYQINESIKVESYNWQIVDPIIRQFRIL